MICVPLCTLVLLVEASIYVVLVFLIGVIMFTEDRGISLGTLRAEATFRDSATDSRRYRRESLCTADLLASAVAGSWANPTPATVDGENDSSSADGENDSSSAEHYYGKEENRRTSDDAAEFAASQVATNNLAGESHVNE